ncbi:MAG TPA: glycoside hydrolase family 43 protein, partial [Roseiarcus sp.]|nr:glycoside hydrolase family 43 protein [Roseiarcus sp.]
MSAIRNPILRGFNPDPSICRVGRDYYIATSTFEWYPGVQIHHSRDLVNWRLVTRPLDRAAQLDLRGDPDSGGVWAPCLSFADVKFWLVYTDVKRLDGVFKDAHNFIVAAPAIDGPWSDPVYVNSSGFDPSLFHDDDGRKWFLNMIWSHRDEKGLRHPAFVGVALQEWDAASAKLVGRPRTIFRGSPHGLVEGPHLCKRTGWYYLTVAEGGTGYDHAVTMARSRRIEGPYELHPNIHLLTSKDAPDAPLQRAGHGQIVETPDGQVYHTHLCSRPLPGLRRSPLGRETAIQKCVWGDDGWLYLEGGGQAPAVDVAAPFAAPAEPKSRRK